MLDERLGVAEECELLTLQDAELAIFDGLNRHHAAPLRTVSALDEQAREEALGAAFGRLLERDLVRHETVDGQAELHIAQPLASLLVLRSAAPQVTLLERRDADQPAFRALYHHGELVVDESVDHEGTHRVQLRRTATLAPVLAAWLAPSEIRSVSGDSVVVRPGDDGWDQLATATVLARW
ncbi:MAG: hypothetical protein GEU93_07460 [Propionibacteriales bacterium]|nr:hypothetical protein [Propionibacteriales bacterium]